MPLINWYLVYIPPTPGDNWYLVLLCAVSSVSWWQVRRNERKPYHVRTLLTCAIKYQSTLHGPSLYRHRPIPINTHFLVGFPPVHLVEGKGLIWVDLDTHTPVRDTHTSVIHSNVTLIKVSEGTLENYLNFFLLTSRYDGF